MNTYITHSGTGFEVNGLCTEKVIDFIKKATETYKKIVEVLGKDIDKNTTLEELEEYETPIDILTECLNEIASTESFVNIEDDDGCQYILFVDRAPWEYTDRERKVTKKEVVSYLKLLEDATNFIEIEDLYIANYIQG